MEIRTGNVCFLEVNLKGEDLVELTSGRTLQTEFSISSTRLPRDFEGDDVDFNIQVSLLGYKAEI